MNNFKRIERDRDVGIVVSTHVSKRFQMNRNLMFLVNNLVTIQLQSYNRNLTLCF